MFKYCLFLFATLSIPGLTLAELRDPTLPGNLPANHAMDMPSPETVPSLSAIWISASNRRAIINGVTVSKGQTLADGSQVLQIKPGYVLIRQHGVNNKIYLVPSVKKPVK